MDRPLPTGFKSEVRSILLADEPRNRFLRVLPWFGACGATLAIHGVLLWYLTQERKYADEPPVQEPAAVMIELAPEVQQAFNQNDQAVGKPMEEAVDMPPPPEEEQPDLIPPVEQAPAEAVAPLPPKPPEKSKEKPPEQKPPPKPKKLIKKPVNKVAPQTASGPKSNQHAESTTAASSGAASSEAVADWKSEVAAALNRSKRPQSESGVVTLRLSVAASGAVSATNIISSSGSSLLDSAATEAAYRASPMPPPPMGATSITFRMNFRSR